MFQKWIMLESVTPPISSMKVTRLIFIFWLWIGKKQRVSLSRKKLIKSPWEIVTEKYAEGDIIDGKVVRIAPFGAFVEIEPGV